MTATIGSSLSKKRHDKVRERGECWVYCLASHGSVSLITRQDISNPQVWPCTTVMFLMLHFLSSGSARALFQGERLREKKEQRKGEKSSKVTFSVFPSELVSSWQGRDSFNFSPLVRSSLFFKRLRDRYKQRKMFPGFSVLSKGHSFLRPYLSVSNGPSVISAK